MNYQTSRPVSPSRSKTALLLTGGGARAAYQVGVLRSLAQNFPGLEFPILTGVSAGAINIALLANDPDPFPATVERLAEHWKTLTLDQVFRTEFRALGTNMARWIFRLLSGGADLLPSTRGMVDTAPLRRFLRRVLDTPDGVLHGVAENSRSGRLSAVGMMTTKYPTAQSVTWVQGKTIQPWHGLDRCGIPTTLTVEHIMASSSLPLVFPAAQLEDTWHGDGGIRLTAPLSPAINLGADRIIAISTSTEPGQSEANRPTKEYPPPATVLSVMLESVFLDMLDSDAVELRRMNRLVAEYPKSRELGLRRVDALIIRPSQDLGVIATEFENELPRSLRHIIRGLGSQETNRSDMIATLLFQPRFIRKMIEIGEKDGANRAPEFAAFLGLIPALPGPIRQTQGLGPVERQRPPHTTQPPSTLAA
jgi:NTE family protein